MRTRLAELSVVARFAFAAGVTFVLGAVAIAIALSSAASIGAKFHGYTDVDVPLSTAINEMYAHGLQGGQATRNVLINHADRTAEKNYEDSVAGFADAYQRAIKYSGGRPDVRAALEAMSPIWQATDGSRRDVQRMAKSGDQEGAIRLLVGTEVVKWREVRGTLLKLIASERNYLQEVRTQLDAFVSASRWKTIVISLLAAGIGGSLLVATIRPVARSLRELVATLNDIAEGDGDITRRLSTARRDEIGQIGRSFNAFMEKLRDTMVRTADVARDVAAASEQIAAAGGTLSAQTQHQASAIEETAASLEEITGTVKQNADNARQASQLAVGSREVADKGGQVVTDAIAAMDEINRSSKKIADIITTIDEIAFQTNLLALNAAVEAARAGEQGRGFAVVAAEVRNLAQRSATAAKEIKTLIQDSVQKVEGGSALVNRSGETLTEIVGSVKRVTDIIAEIAAASTEQSSGIDQVNKAVAQMDQVTQANAARTEELSSTAQTLAAQAKQLRALVGRFRLDDGASPQAPLSRELAMSASRRPTPPLAREPQVSPRASRRPRASGAALAVAAHDGGRPGTDGHAAESFEEF